MLRRKWLYVVVSIGVIVTLIASSLPLTQSVAARSAESAPSLSSEVTSPTRMGAASVEREQATTQAPVTGSPPVESRLVRAHTFTGDLRNLPSVEPVKRERPEREEPDPNPIELPGAASQGSSPIAPIGPSAPAPAPNITFDGLDFATWGAGHPPDPNGDVGPTYYIQTINTSVGIYTKTTGSLVTAFTFDTLMSQGNFGNLCDTDNFGDPVVLYDSFEDRWIITDFAFTLDGSGNVINPPGSFECIAVSRSGDPVTGGWNFYSINTTGGLGDYPKFGIWPDGLYMSANMFGYPAGAAFQNVRVYAFNKSQMYAGDSSVQVVSFDVADTGEFTLLPANARLQAGTPPAGTPNYFISTWEYLNALTVYKFHVDWSHLAASTFTGPDVPATGSSWPNASVPNAATPGNSVDVLQIRAMVQNQYTNIGGAESLWTTHTVRRFDTSGFATPRWYQVNVTSGTVAANTVQAATWDPDGANVTYRFMPSLAVDRMGDMAIGYSTSNSTTNPGMKYAGRLYTDTLSTLPQTEQTLYQGTGTQTGTCGGSTCTRWGDYSAMTLDPNGCTFWYTNEYYAVSGLNFLTRIGSFQYPSCTTVGSGAISGTVTDAGTSSPMSGVTVTLGSRSTTTNGSGVYQFLNIPAGVYPSVSARYPGYSSSSAGPITVTTSLTTTQNFALNTSSASGCFMDTSQTDFQTGVATNCDLTSSPGNVILQSSANIDQQNTTLGTSGVGVTTATWGGQTFTPATSGQLTRVDINLFCSGCTGTTPNLTLSLRATSGGLPTGTDLASATITGFNSGAAVFYTANFASPPTLTAGTQYALVIRPTANPAPGTYALTRSGTSTAGSDVYAGGTRVSGATSGTVWSIPLTGGVSTDAGFKTYMQTGYATAGSFVSNVKDANPSLNEVASWTTLSWNATTPVNTSIRFQVAGSNSSTGPFNFVGPDGTSSTYYTTSGASLSQFNGLRYLKYTAYLTSTNSASTPTLADVTVCFNNIATSPSVWNGTTDTNWFIAGNWNPAFVPTAASDVIIPTAPSGNRWPVLTGTTTIYTLTVQTGAAVTVTQGITLSVNGGVTNNGTLVQIKNAPASTPTEFLHITDATGAATKYRGVDLNPSNNLGSTTVVITTTTGATCTTTLSGSPAYAHRCYTITPTTSAAATVRLWALTSELNGILEANLTPYHYTAGAWVPLTSISTGNDGGSYSFAQGDTTGFSPFLLGSITAPTSITFEDITARSNASALPIALIAFGGLVGVLAFWQVRKRQRVR